MNITEPLAFILFIITEPQSLVTVELAPYGRMDCRTEAPIVAEAIEADGFIVDFTCAYGDGPTTSPRPIARPTGEEI